MLLSRRRRRSGTYAVAASSTAHGFRRVVSFLFLVLAVALVGWVMFRMMSTGEERLRVATMLSAAGRGRVEVTINGEGDPQRAESGLRLYEGDRIRTDGFAYATLSFFDGTFITLDGNSAIVLQNVIEGSASSRLDVKVETGRVFVQTGTGTTVTRRIETVFALSTVPPKTMMILGEGNASSERTERLAVFQTTGPGVVSILQTGGLVRDEVVTGEGQELNLSLSSLNLLKQERRDSYELRGILKQDDFLTSAFFTFVMSQEPAVMPTVSSTGEGASSDRSANVDGEEFLVIEAPEDGALAEGDTVLVQGRVGSRVSVVRVNGYVATLQEGSFEKEIALPAEESVMIEVQADDADGITIAEKSLTVQHDLRPPESPVITAPARVTKETMADMTPVAVQEESFEITGEAPAEAVGIMVNGYRLQKFVPGKPWAYLVDAAIDNVRVGENTYDVVAIDRAGNQSEPVRIVILWRAQPMPDVSDDDAVDSIKIAPGSLRVIAPTDGSLYVTSEKEILIEGTTAPETASMSVNGYTLSLYLAGKTTWNYIAKEEFGNFTTGVNLYTVVARNAEGKILDVVRYEVERR